MLRRLAPFAVLLAVLFVAPHPTRADDVPEEIRELYAEARVHQTAGDLKKAYSALSKARMKQPLSVDFWELYVQVWRALGKKEDVLWKKIIGPVEKKRPKSAVFALLRARLAESVEERIRYLREAIAKEPDAVAPSLLLAKAMLENGDDIEADELLDGLLAKHPDDEEALVTKGELALEMGRSLTALEYAEKQLEKHPLAGLHDLRARALLAAAENDRSRLDVAEAAARRAVSMRKDPRFVRTLVDVLDAKGDLEQAVKLLDESYGKYPAPVLASKLGELAFRSGDYEKAVRGLAADPDPSTRVLKGLALAYARLGDVEAMRRVLARLAHRLEESDPSWIGRVEVIHGDPARALEALRGGDEDDDTRRFLRLNAYARLGDVKAARAVADDRARTGERADEEYLLQLLCARVAAKLGPKAAKALEVLRDGAVAAAKASVPGAEAKSDDREMHANSPEFIERAIGYRRSAGGKWFHAAFDEDTITIDVNERGPDRAVLRLGVKGSAECPVEPERWFWFNPLEVRAQDLENKDRETWVKETLARLFGVTGQHDWEDTSRAFAEGCAAVVDESFGKARGAFEKAAEAEPDWGRAKLFGAAALALDGGDAAQAAREAVEALRLLPDDYDGARLVVLLELLAGQDGKETAATLGRQLEAHCTRRLEWL